jgi:beta-mannanase
MASLLRLEHAVGRLDITHLFQAWGSPDTAEFRREWVEDAALDDRLVLLTWEPWAPADGSVQPRFKPAQIAAGRHDSFVERWASSVAALRIPVWLRPMHEMNGTWYPWAGGVGGNRPNDYVAAWRHLHGIFGRAGAANVRWVWAPHTPDVPVTNAFEQYYPGDGYVDVLGLDGYNWGSGFPENGGWRSFADVFGNAYERVVRVGPQPVWITETASSAIGGDKARWVSEMFDELERMTRVEAVVWFDLNKESDWGLSGAEDVTAAFANHSGRSSA